MVGNQLGSIGGVAEQLSGRLGGIGSELLGGLQQGAQAFAPGAQTAISQLLGITQGQDAASLREAATGQLPGTDFLSEIAGGARGVDLQGVDIGGGLDFQQLLEPGAQVGGQLDALDRALQRNLQSTLGSLGGQATLAGQTGGGRQAFLSSEAAGRAQEAFGAGASDILGADLAARRGLAGTAAGFELGQQGQQIQQQQALNALGVQQAGQQGGLQLGAAQALQQGGLGQAGLQGGNLAALLQAGLGGATGAGGIGLGQQQTQLGAGEAGLGQLGNLFNLGLQPFAAQLGPLQAFADILGGPTVLGQSAGFGQGSSRTDQFGSSFGRGSTDSFGFNFLA